MVAHNRPFCKPQRSSSFGYFLAFNRPAGYKPRYPLQRTAMGVAKSRRNQVLDLLRGHFLIAILVDHLIFIIGRPSWFRYYNGMGRLWVSAAEGFVFISGFLMGRIYRRRLVSRGTAWVVKHLLKRACVFHVLCACLTVMYTVLARAAGRGPNISLGLQDLSALEALGRALTFRYAYGWADLLMLYTVLTLASIAALLALRNGLGLLVGLFSCLAYVWVQVLPEVNRVTGSPFPIPAWQFLFFLALCFGYYADKVRPLYYRVKKNRLIMTALVLIFGVSLFGNIMYVFYGKWRVYKEEISWLFNRLELGPGRIVLFLLWFMVIYAAVRRFLPYIHAVMGWLWDFLGRRSLVTYVCESMILFAVFYLPRLRGRWRNDLLILACVMVVWLMVHGYAWLTPKQKKPPALASPASL